MKQTAQKLASKGRFGDSMLVHMNPVEVSGLASLMPEGELSINPDTGLPEAFFFLPFLAALGGMGTAAAGGAAAAGLGTALTAGLGAGIGAAGLTAAGGAAAGLAGTAAAIPALAAAPAAALSVAAPAASAIAGPMSVAGPMSTIASGMPSIGPATAMSQIPAAGLPSIQAAGALPAELTSMSTFAGGPVSPELAASKSGLSGLTTGPMPGNPLNLTPETAEFFADTSSLGGFDTAGKSLAKPPNFGGGLQGLSPPQPDVTAPTRGIGQIRSTPVKTSIIKSPLNASKIQGVGTRTDPVGKIPIPRPRPTPPESFGSNARLDSFGSSVEGNVPTTAETTPLPRPRPTLLTDSPEKSGLFGTDFKAKDFLLPAVLASALLPKGDYEDDEEEYDSSGEVRYDRGEVDFSGDPTNAGQFEHSFFPDATYSLRFPELQSFARGGIIGGPNQRPAPNLSAFNNPGTQAVNNTMPYQAMNNAAPQAQANSPAFGGANPMSQGIAPSQNMTPGFGTQPPAYGAGGISPSPSFGWGTQSDVSNNRYGGQPQTGPNQSWGSGIMNGYAGGGIVRKPVDNSYAQGGLAGLDSGSVMGQNVPGGIMPEQGTESQDKQLVMMTIAAIQGQIPNAEKIIQLFIETFGEEAFADLMARLEGGDGKSDSVPAQINSPQGSQPAQLSEGEYVVPADVVSNMGKGSTDAGGRQLDSMVAGQRGMMQPQQPQQPFQFIPGKV